MGYLDMCEPHTLTINELRERNNWIATIPSKCQECGFTMPDSTKMVCDECEDTHLDDGETCDDPHCLCHQDCEINECLTCLEYQMSRAEDAYDASRGH